MYPTTLRWGRRGAGGGGGGGQQPRKHHHSRCTPPPPKKNKIIIKFGLRRKETGGGRGPLFRSAEKTAGRKLARKTEAPCGSPVCFERAGALAK